MASWTSTRISATGRHINIAPGGLGHDDLLLDEPEPEILTLDPEEPSLSQAHEEPECVPYLASRVLFLPLPSGDTLRRVRFLGLPLQMLRR